jgi:hypothetical protein
LARKTTPAILNEDHAPQADRTTPEIARAFVRNMHAFFAENSTIKADEIAIRQLIALNEYLCGRQKPLRVTDVKEMFLQMRDEE